MNYFTLPNVIATLFEGISLQRFSGPMREQLNVYEEKKSKINYTLAYSFSPNFPSKTHIICH